MLGSVLLKTMRDTSRSLMWWSLGLVGLVAMMVAVFPSVRGNLSLNKLVDDYPKALKAFITFGGAIDYTSAPGYLGSELFSFMVPLLLLVAAIGAGARAIAGEEEHGTLDLLLANPIPRSRLVIEKLAALAAELAVLALVLWSALAVGTRLAGMDVGLGNLGAASFDAALLAFVYGALAMLVGAATGRRGLAIALPSAAAVAAYLVNALAVLVAGLDPVRKASPFYHYAAGDPLRHGLSLGHTAVLVLVALALASLAPPALARRDLT
jgi:ABC-2 type transport system permease protein